MKCDVSEKALLDQRIGIFVDVQNLFYSAKTIHHSKINFEKLLQIILKGRKLIRAIAYIVQKGEDHQQAFIDVLKRLGYEVRSKDLRVRADGTAKGDWDMGIAIDTMSLVNKLDTVVLVSGDGDFAPLVEMLKANGCRVEVYSFPESTSNDLIVAATSYKAIEETILLKQNSNSGKEKKYKKNKK
ncbi:MAG: NYN domain-containing protein [Candidatus Aureabacteria bacterium]|nr:NYN domain-containing protein [Candidatus Auribacterota bacterium]